MTPEVVKSHRFPVPPCVKKQLFLTVAFCAATVFKMASSMADQPYNPDGLGADQFKRVAQACESVMGLSPNEGLTSGYWSGNDRLDRETNHHNGCILSLSDSLQSVVDAEMARHAEHIAISNRSDLGGDQRSTLSVTALVPWSERSFFALSPNDTVRREQAACATLALSPVDPAVQACVRQLDSTFYTIDHPMN